MTGKKTSVDDIIGIVKTEEVTNSVEEVRKLRGRETMTKKRFTRKSYSIWDNMENKEFYELHYRYEVDDMCNILNNYEEKVKSLGKENEQLKTTIKDVVELLSEEVDLFSDKALEHDICAYIELREFDNKDAFYMATATKKAIKMLKELEE